MVQSRIKQLERLPELQPVEKEPEAVLKFPDIEKLSGCVIQLSEVSFRYSENLPTCFTNVDLSANADSRICIVSTFMDSYFFKIVLGLEAEPHQGTTHYWGLPYQLVTSGAHSNKQNKQDTY